MKHLGLTVLLCCTTLTGCGNGSLEDLQEYVDNAKSQPQAGVKKLPSIPDYEPIPFEGLGLADPFFPRRPVVSGQNSGVKVDVPKPPDANRPKEHLEQFALDQLKITGFVSDRQKRPVALIQAPDHRVHMVGVGQYMGTNFGRVSSVSESGITLKEQVYDSGVWQTRDVNLANSASK